MKTMILETREVTEIGSLPRLLHQISLQAAVLAGGSQSLLRGPPEWKICSPGSLRLLEFVRASEGPALPAKRAPETPREIPSGVQPCNDDHVHQ